VNISHQFTEKLDLLRVRKHIVAPYKPKFLKSLNTRKQKEAFGQAVNSDVVM
jgi:hypothetical protein